MKQPLNDKVITCLSHYIYTCMYLFWIRNANICNTHPLPPKKNTKQTNKTKKTKTKVVKLYLLILYMYRIEIV